MMIRRLFTLVLCLMMALTLPLNALAATEYTISMIPGDELGAEAGIKDFFDALSLRLLCGEESGALTLSLGGTDAASIALRGDEKGIYAQSALLGEKPLYFSVEDVTNFATLMMEQSDEADEAAINAMKQSINQMFTSFGMVSAAQGDAELELDFSELDVEKIDAMFKDDPGMAAYIKSVLEGLKITDGDFTDAAHDPATQMLEMVITNKELEHLADSKMFYESINAAAQEKGETMTAEEAAKAFKEQLAKMELNIPITMYTADEGETLVAMNIPMSFKGTNTITVTADGKETTKTEDVEVDLDMTYNQLTVDKTVTYSGAMIGKENGKDRLDASVTVVGQDEGQYDLTGVCKMINDDKTEEVMSLAGALTRDEKKANGWFGMLADEVQITFGYESVTTADGKDKSIAIYQRSGATSVIELSAADRPLATLKVSVNNNASEDGLAAVNAATPENATQLLQLNETEMQTAMQGISTSAMQGLYTVLGLLPASTLELFMGTEETAPATAN